MSTVAETVRARLDPSLSTAGLVLGDLLAVGTFVVVGEISHSVDLVANPGRVVGTLLPFLIGWALVAIPAGVYGSAARTSVRRMALTATAAWAIAVVVAQTLRATELFPGNAALTFALVSFGIGGLLLVGYRVVVVVLTNRRSDVVAPG
jgi:hypothetical protein